MKTYFFSGLADYSKGEKIHIHGFMDNVNLISSRALAAKIIEKVKSEHKCESFILVAFNLVE